LSGAVLGVLVLLHELRSVVDDGLDVFAHDVDTEFLIRNEEWVKRSELGAYDVIV
jgi:hypothetical protein